MWRSVTLFLILLLPACGLLPKNVVQDTKNWSASKYYSEAKTELNEGNYAGAIKLFEQLEARYPYGRYAQQAQLEIAYAYYKDAEQASAIAAADWNRFAGSFSRAVRITRSICSGRSGRNFEGGGGAISRCARMRSNSVSPRKGGDPVMHSNSNTPAA